MSVIKKKFKYGDSERSNAEEKNGKIVSLIFNYLA